MLCLHCILIIFKAEELKSINKKVFVLMHTRIPSHLHLNLLMTLILLLQSPDH